MADSQSVAVHNLAASVQAFTSNVFLVPGEQPALVDAGNDFDVVSAVREHPSMDGTDLSRVVLTHTHPDHVGNAEAVRDRLDVPVWGFDADHPAVDRELADGQTIELGDATWEAVHTPGHAVDHLALSDREGDVLFAGDLVFEGGAFGRTDIPGSDRATLVESIERLLETVEDVETLHAGHGPSVTGGARETVQLALRNARSR